MTTTLLTPVAATGLPDSVTIDSSASLNNAKDVLETDWVASADSETLSAEALDRVDWAALGRLDGEQDAAILAAYSDDPLADVRDRLPTELSILATNPTAARVVAIRRSAIEGGVNTWAGLLARASNVAFVRSSAGSGFPAAVLPQLVPPAPSTGPRSVVDAVRTASGDTNVRAGLLLMHDFLEESHTLAQKSGGPNGDYWHAIVHRREPDPSNARYWFRRVGEHPVFAELARAAEPILAAAGEPMGGDWDPSAFVDLCERARSGSGSGRLRDAARRVQFAEMVLLLAHCAG